MGVEPTAFSLQTQCVAHHFFHQKELNQREMGLGGEIQAVPHLEQRMTQASKHGD